MLKEVNIAEQLPQLDFTFKLLDKNVLPVFINLLHKTFNSEHTSLSGFTL